MFISVSYWIIVAVVIAAWVFNVCCNTKPASCSDEYWRNYVLPTLVRRANDIFKSLFLILFGFIGNHVYFIGYQLTFITWIVRVICVIFALAEVKTVLINIVSMLEDHNPGDKRIVLSGLVYIGVYAFIFSAI